MSESASHANDEGLDRLDLSLIQNRLTGKVFARGSLCESRIDISGAAIEGVVAELFVDDLRRRCQVVPDAELDLLTRLFLAGGGANGIAVLPSDDHPSKPLRPWQPFYELEMDAAQTYICRFLGGMLFRPVRGFPNWNLMTMLWSLAVKCPIWPPGSSLGRPISRRPRSASSKRLGGPNCTGICARRRMRH